MASFMRLLERGRFARPTNPVGVGRGGPGSGCQNPGDPGGAELPDDPGSGSPKAAVQTGDKTKEAVKPVDQKKTKHQAKKEVKRGKPEAKPQEGTK